MNWKLKFEVIRTGRYQFEIALEAGMSEVRFSKIINGRIDPSPIEREKIADALGVPVGDLFEEPQVNKKLY
jgi:transcriptional regulator with XRE-family HTH domain